MPLRRARRDHDPLRQRERQHEAVVVVGVLADQVDPAGRRPQTRPGPRRTRPGNASTSGSPRSAHPRNERPGVGDDAREVGSRRASPARGRSRSREATSAGGSPGAAARSTAGTGCPVTWRTASTTSRTEKPVPLPRL